jgi:hypothetical protein
MVAFTQGDGYGVPLRKTDTYLAFAASMTNVRRCAFGSRSLVV